MRLQSDPTVIYAVTDGRLDLNRSLKKKDLKIQHPYNTYVIPALPAGPIGNPGKEAIKAVLNPAQTDALYFVATGRGGHAFAKTLKEHNKNIQNWLKVLRQKRAK